MIAISIIALVISACALPFTAWAAKTAAKQAKVAAEQTQIQKEQVAAAREQTQLQREIAQEEAQPYVWADIQPDMQQGTTMQVVIGNSGPTIARNVRVKFDPPLPASEAKGESVLKVERMLSKGLKSLAPGRTIRWALGPGHDLLASEEPQNRKVTINAEGPHGELREAEIEIDLSQIRQSRDAPDGSLHHVRSSIKDLTKVIEGIGSFLKQSVD